MIGFIIIILLLIVLILWGRWEIKHAISMPEDFDPRSKDEKIFDNSNKQKNSAK